jgi:hypothetical protein
MFAEVIRTRTSVGRSIRASGTSLTLTWRGPSYTTAFTLVSSLVSVIRDALDVDRGGAGRSSIGRWAETLRYR